jgi:Na+/H+ antiporter NhaD/arsenite permease-like protein
MCLSHLPLSEGCDQLVTTDQIFLISLLGILVGFFVWERWRYDLVALAGLLIATLFGLIPPDEAFLGFGHPAVVTVAAVLIISRGLSNAGAVEIFTRYIKRATSSPTLHVVGLSSVGGLLSTVMNNVGALALLMPVAIQSSLEKRNAHQQLFWCP